MDTDLDHTNVRGCVVRVKNYDLIGTMLKVLHIVVSDTCPMDLLCRACTADGDVLNSKDIYEAACFDIGKFIVVQAAFVET